MSIKATFPTSSSFELTVGQSHQRLSFIPHVIDDDVTPYYEAHTVQENAKIAAKFHESYHHPDHAAAQAVHVDNIMRHHQLAAITEVQLFLENARAAIESGLDGE